MAICEYQVAGLSLQVQYYRPLVRPHLTHFYIARTGNLKAGKQVLFYEHQHLHCVHLCVEENRVVMGVEAPEELLCEC